VDSSADAISSAILNLSLNPGLDSSKANFYKADAIDYMKECLSRGDEFDLIVLDPPKMAPNAKSLNNATKKYVLNISLFCYLLFSFFIN
jgi:23S rRNA (cytosine1962-C5)-methyltransferase